MRARLLGATRLIRTLAAANRWLTVAVFALAVVGGVLVPAFALASGWLVGSVTDGDSIVLPLTALVAVYVVGRVLDPLRVLVNEMLWRQTDEALNRRLMSAMEIGRAHV